MKKYSLLVSIILAATLIVGWIGFKHYQNQLDKAQAANKALTMTADLSIGRANTSLEEAKKHIKDLDEQIQKDIKDRSAKIDSIGEIQTKYITHNVGGLIVTPPKIIEVNGKCTIASTPFAYKDFRLDASGDATTKTFKYTLTQKFEIIFAETKLSNGGINNYAELYELDALDKRVGRMEITKFNVWKNPIDPKRFKFWDPAVDILAGGILSRDLSVGFNGNIGISVASYGRYRNLDWRFLRAGIGVDKMGLELSLTPVQYNVAQPIPLINNLWLSPSVGYNLDSKIYFLGLGIAATL